MKGVTMDSVKPKVLTPGMYAIDVEPTPLAVGTIEETRVERALDRSLSSAFLYTKHSQELLEYVVGTCLKDFNKRDKKHATAPFNKKKQVAFEDQCETSNNNTLKHVEQLNMQKTNVYVITFIGVNSCTDASGSKPKSNIKKNRISPAKNVNKQNVEEHPRTNKSSLKNTNHVVQIVFWYLDSGCSKHMTRDRSWLKNFMKKFIRAVRFENDHFGAIMGYGIYVISDIVSSRHSCYVRDTDGAELIRGSRGSKLYTILVEDMMKSSSICLLFKASKNKSWLWHRRLNHLNFSTINDLASKDLVRGLPRLKFAKDHLCSAFPMTPQQNVVVERRNRTLVEEARTMLIYSKALMFL
nr:hypothetical protein [Tanacetum cinerariifolium]